MPSYVYGSDTTFVAGYEAQNEVYGDDMTFTTLGSYEDASKRVLSIRHIYKSYPYPDYRMVLGLAKKGLLPDYTKNLDKLKVKLRQEMVSSAVSILEKANSPDTLTNLNNPILTGSDK